MPHPKKLYESLCPGRAENYSVQKELSSSENEGKTCLLLLQSSRPPMSPIFPCSRITLQAGNASQYLKQHYGSLGMLPVLVPGHQGRVRARSFSHRRGGTSSPTQPPLARGAPRSWGREASEKGRQRRELRGNMNGKAVLWIAKHSQLEE